QAQPSTVSHLCRQQGRAHDVGEQQGDQDARWLPVLVGHGSCVAPMIVHLAPPAMVATPFGAEAEPKERGRWPNPKDHAGLLHGPPGIARCWLRGGGRGWR